jgi:hypothetical protein
LVGPREKKVKFSPEESVWVWQADPFQKVAAEAHRPNLRRQAVVQAAVLAGVGAVLFFLLHHRLLGQIVWGLGGVFLLMGLIYPPAYSPIYRFGQRLGRLVGGLLLYLLLVPFFFLFFLPVSLLLQLQGRDPLSRRRRAAGLTYWIPRLRQCEMTQYQRQFLLEDKEARRIERPIGKVDDLFERNGA